MYASNDNPVVTLKVADSTTPVHFSLQLALVKARQHPPDRTHLDTWPGTHALLNQKEMVGVVRHASELKVNPSTAALLHLLETAWVVTG